MRITSEDTLEFSAFKALLRRFVSSPLGAVELDKSRPTTDRPTLISTFADIAEAIEHERALNQPQPAARGSAIRVRFSGIPDCREAVSKLRIEGSVLEGKEILDVTSLLEKALEVRDALVFSSERYPRLADRATAIGDFRPILRELSGKLMPDGTLADDASVALNRLRREVERQHRRIQSSLERFLRVHREEGVLQEEFVTIRNDRFVVPIVSGRQRRVDGVIHGASGTGHTLFLEPLETIELNNDLVHLTEEALREEFRILREMTGRLRTALDDILVSVQIIGELDFVFAKARFAVQFGAVVPLFSLPGKRRFFLRDARHPLLQDVLEKQRKPIVPITVELDENSATLLISGPNTGGKTVSLKTAGLLPLMAQSGFPVTAAEAEFPVFEEVLADIGDNQSIEQSLSTFSAHITRIREMLEEVKPDSLVLLDELGRATDPEEGGALGVALLDEFRRSGAFTLASTHLLALKIYGATTADVLNASMGFDDETLEPTYQLRIGAPGKSAGLDIASRLGLSPALIERARNNMSTSERDIALFLDQLHEKLEHARRLEQELVERRKELEERQRDLAGEWRRRETKKLAELERRVHEVIQSFEARAGETITAIERQSEGRKAAERARRSVSRAQRELREQVGRALGGSEEPTAGKEELVEGTMVRLRDVREPARVSRILRDGLIEVQAGFLKLQVEPGDIVEVLSEQTTVSRLPENVTMKAGPKAYATTREVNVIGRRAEEARSEVDKFLDSAALASVDRVRIIHGHGMGVLKKTIAELLDGHPHVAKFYPASPGEGGSGATIAELRD